MQDLFSCSNEKVLVLRAISASIPDGNRILGLPAKLRNREYDILKREPSSFFLKVMHQLLPET
jgi:hypothetical protein